ncbi:MAG TPA: hypothetical protein VD927_17495 [Chryseosolibacter sp.]|nr:hypothetical protein [Chryseosolibacter sp.]
MENYRIYFDGTERNEVVRILRSYNDVIIDNMDDHSIGITIEKDDDGVLYRSIMDIINRDVYSSRAQATSGV